MQISESTENNDKHRRPASDAACCCVADGPLNIIALSGGKDSTALALRLNEISPKEYTYICTPTGDELPEMEEHWKNLECLLGQKILRLHAKLNLNELITFYNALPNWRQRWCTRQLKIEVSNAFYLKHPGSTVYVGLRADEPQREGGIFGAHVKQKYPMRDWGWNIADVWGYLEKRGISIPRRTDCARCYYQTLGEWWDLWKDYPALYLDAERQENETGHTFRSPSRDSWPAKLSDMRTMFERGEIPRGASVNGDLFQNESKCRACSI